MNVSPDTRFNEATSAQFREFWEAQGWRVGTSMQSCMAVRNPRRGPYICVKAYFKGQGRIAAGLNETDSRIEFDELIATFGEALRLANNLAQAELFGGWAE